MAPKSHAEKHYLAFAKEYSAGFYTARPEAAMEGFEYLESPEYLDSCGDSKVGFRTMLFGGGLVDTSPLAGKAGMGWQGKNGLLITPEYGQRVRIAPIFIENKIFEYTDNDSHRWIEEFCKSCGNCRRKCPAGAIYDEKVTSIDNVAGIERTRTCIDREKCYPQFSKTLGCSICIKSCPFSRGEGSYDKIKAAFEKKKRLD